MDTLMAFSLGQATRHKELMVFDWNKAAKLIKEYKPDLVSAGLSGDWGFTSGYIYKDGRPLKSDETYTYLASTWAMPEIEIDGEVQDCFIMQSKSDNWDAHTFWPDSALEILKNERL